MKNEDILIVNDINEIKELWLDLYNNNDNLTPFQSYEWNLTLQKIYKESNKLSGNRKVYFYLIYKRKLILPLEIDKKSLSIYILGQSQCSDYLDFIYRDIKKEYIEQCILYLNNRYKGYSLIFDRINERSSLIEVLNKLQYKKKEKKACYYIDIPKDEEFYNLLSKSARQNFRTANNRVTKSNLNFNINLENKVIDNYKRYELYNLYRKRRINKDSINNKSKLICQIKEKVKNIIVSNRTDLIYEYSKNNDMFLSTIDIDGKIIAYYQGICSKKNNIIYIVRVAIDDDYKSFSPGVILLINTIEKLKGIYDVFDLTRGDEKYKLQHKGVLNYNYIYIL